MFNYNDVIRTCQRLCYESCTQRLWRKPSYYLRFPLISSLTAETVSKNVLAADEAPGPTASHMRQLEANHLQCNWMQWKASAGAQRESVMEGVFGLVKLRENHEQKITHMRKRFMHSRSFWALIFTRVLADLWFSRPGAVPVRGAHQEWNGPMYRGSCSASFIRNPLGVVLNVIGVDKTPRLKEICSDYHRRQLWGFYGGVYVCCADGVWACSISCEVRWCLGCITAEQSYEFVANVWINAQS